MVLTGHSCTSPAQVSIIVIITNSIKKKKKVFFFLNIEIKSSMGCYLQDPDGLAQTQIDIRIQNVSNKAKWDFKAIQIQIGPSKHFVSKMT